MMVPRTTTKPRQLVILSGIFVLTISLCKSAVAQEATETPPPEMAPPAENAVEPAAALTEEAVPVVTLNVENGSMTQVLKAFSLQTGKSIVIGPEVVSTNVNVHLSDVAWDDALEVILKPYGYGYTTTGKAIVVNRLDKIAAVKAVEPLQSKVFTLKYLDASDIKETIEKHLSGRGSMSVLTRKGLVGWQTDSTSRYTSSRSGGSTLGMREREEAPPEELQKSKTFIITDIPSVIESVQSILAEVDVKPVQVLIEAKFMEVNVNYLKDIGVDFYMELDDFTADSLFSLVEPNGFKPAASSLQGDPLNARGAFSFSPMDDPTADIFLRLLQEDDDSNLLSSPKVLTLNNQEATIIVGTKFPIIRSNTSGLTTAVTSTSLEYYESIGIQLNVVPQVCNDDQINMIVHPSVSEKEGETSGITSTGDTTSALTTYPIISVREVETQIILKDGETVVIGGLMQQRAGKSVFKVPLLGDIPYLGYLFRRTVNSTDNIELLVFLKATIIDPDSYAQTSADEHDALDAKRIVNKNKEKAETEMATEAVMDPVPEAAETVEAPMMEMPVAVEAATEMPAEETPAEMEGPWTVTEGATAAMEAEMPAEETAPAMMEEAPAMTETEMPAEQTAPAMEEAPAEEMAPAMEEAPAEEVAPAMEEAPAAVEAEAPAAEAAPAMEEAPAMMEEAIPATTNADTSVETNVDVNIDPAAEVEQIMKAAEDSATSEGSI